MTSIVDQLRKGRDIPQVALQNYITLRSKNSNDLICVFEGHDDYPYYDTTFRRITDSLSYRPLIANGKDQVLGLRVLLSARPDYSQHSVAYFIDRDFDGYKSHTPQPDIYCTHGYSIENNLCHRSILPSLLNAEFMCIKAGDTEKIREITAVIDSRLNEFFTAMRDTNLAIYTARKSGFRLLNIENQITKYLTINLQNVSFTGAPYLSLIGWPAEEDISAISVFHESTFDSLDPELDWRGKYLMGTYIELLHKLKEDRCSIAPQLFAKKQGVKFNPKGDIVRVLSLLSPIPDCLRDFVQRMVDIQRLPATSQT
jgi:hypothetical protein